MGQGTEDGAGILRPRSFCLPAEADNDVRTTTVTLVIIIIDVAPSRTSHLSPPAAPLPQVLQHHRPLEQVHGGGVLHGLHHPSVGT